MTGSGNAGEAASIAALVADFPGIDKALQMRYRCLTASQVNYILGDTGRSFVVGVGKNYPLAPHSREAFCAIDMKAPVCNSRRWNEDVASQQIVVGAMVAGPDLNDDFVDSRQHYQYTEIAIDSQSAFISALTAALTMPGEFWHDGNTSELEQACAAVGFKHYNWDS